MHRITIWLPNHIASIHHPEAYAYILRAMREENRLLGLQRLKVDIEFNRRKWWQTNLQPLAISIQTGKGIIISRAK